MAQLYEIKISCRDRPGIIAAVAGFIHHEAGGNIVELNHHTEEAKGLFFLICRFSVPDEAGALVGDLRSHPGFRALQRAYDWKYDVYRAAHRPKIAALVTQTDHCLYELILKIKDGYLKADLACVLSNRDVLEPVARRFDLPFHHVPIDGDRPRQEAAVDALLDRYGVETVALARYMQILSPEFVSRWEHRIVNVHHGFLPAFKGSRPYHQAWEKGVKLIGATAHYATTDLDEGPILYQDVAPVRNNLSIQEFIETGQDVERKVLVEGLKLHLEHRVFIRDGRTILL